MENIETLVELFRQFGGKFENMTLRYSEESGYYCYTLNDNQDSVVSCPANLLVDIVDVDINTDGLFIKNPEKYGNNMEFLRQYFKFHFNKKMLNSHTEKKRQITSLSSSDLSLISKVLPPELYDLKECKNLEYEKNRMFDCHKINFYGKVVLMPFVTFLNYNKNAELYTVNKNAISISGKFNGEVVCEYQLGDALIMGGHYEFIADVKYAYSLPLWFNMPGGVRVIIKRSLMHSSFTDNGRRKPLVEKKGKTVTISWFPLYYQGSPRYPAVVASMVAAETNLSAEKLIFEIIRLNLQALIPVAFQLKESENSFAKFIAAVSQRQLENISDAV